MDNQKLFWVGYNKNDAIRNGQSFSTFAEAAIYAQSHCCGSIWLAPTIVSNIDDLEYLDSVENTLLPKIRKPRG